MKYQNIVAYSSIIAGLLGCEENTPKPPKYFATVPMDYETGMTSAVGDFDGDGDLDLIVGARSYSKHDNDYSARLYLYLNDGKGNFTLKEPNQEPNKK